LKPEPKRDRSQSEAYDDEIKKIQIPQTEPAPTLKVTMTPVDKAFGKQDDVKPAKQESVSAKLLKRDLMAMKHSPINIATNGSSADTKTTKSTL
jgi:hypothetical protein